MSDKENYFRNGTSIEDINDTLYTDHGFLSDWDALQDDLNNIEHNDKGEEEIPLDPPF